ncbi:DUF6932 family protein [Henriciella marina]|uniref:DUF6932 family protein n=1 Tax=Henriciella marina TaxID=453851 RepID=UPI0012EA3B74|nr:hypothetical protein [Henriciella marina]
MPIPHFNHEGVLPPYVGPSPGGDPSSMSPYKVSAMEVVHHFASTPNRIEILKGWIRHRQELRALGFDRGFQWLDGSFLEDKEPDDLDIAGFLYVKDRYDEAGFLRLMRDNPNVLSRAEIRAAFRLDFLPVDLAGTPESIIDLSRYFLGLFSHRRGDIIWKGMLQVSLSAADNDDAALNFLNQIG